MTIKQAYLQFKLLVEENATNNNVSIDLFRFITVFNQAIITGVEWILEKRNEDDIRYVSPLLVVDKDLGTSISSLRKETFELPSNYFDFSNLSVLASKGNCKKQRLATFEVKSEDTEELEQDEHNKPSFEFRETFFFLANNSVVLFRTDFNIDKAFLTYYRYPAKVDIEGYINPYTGQPSVNVDPDLDDKVINRFLKIAAKDYFANNNDPGNYQLSKDRVVSKQ